jgi:lipoprotein-anchoring transpeptidase ErfK/SrfK
MYADFKWFLFQDLYGSILIHSVPYTRQGEDKVYDQLDALGLRPASRGCVRISPEDAAWLKAWDPVGVPIEISAWPGRIEQVVGT